MRPIRDLPRMFTMPFTAIFVVGLGMGIAAPAPD